jgi:protein involved in polysaccharide export with SLBB domain
MSFKYLRLQALILLFFTFLSPLYSQSLDLSQINFRDLSSSQLETLSRQASAMGYSKSDLLTAAKSQGLSSSEIAGFENQLSQQATTRVAKSNNTPVSDSRLRETYQDSLTFIRTKKSDVFGFDVFKGNGLLTFQPNINMPTPKNYILGAGDQVYIDIYGQSEAYYELEINPQGNLILENFGPIKVSGLTTTQAKRAVIARLSSIYSGLNNDQPDTFISLSVGNSRTIQVNITGEVSLPGTYNFSAFNSVYNALYVAGGLSENASFRDIKVYRNSRLISSIDIYKYLTSGDSSSDIRLESNDLILVSPYKNRVTLSGAIKKQGRFEFKEGESLADIIDYAGGFAENAFTKSIKVTRIKDGEKVVADVHEDQLNLFYPHSGDVYQVGEVLDKYKNRVIVKGAVYRPGIFAISNGMGIKDLIGESEGLKPEALTSMAYIIRTNDDLTTKTISFNLKNILNGSEKDILLDREDILHVLSKYDLSDELYLKVEGEVNQPGTFSFSEGMTLKELLLIAGGFKTSATGKNIEITRRLQGEQNDPSKVAEVILFDLDKDFAEYSDKTKDLILKPFDHIVVRKDPQFFVQTFAYVIGEVEYPGRYAISSKNQKVSDILSRSGGLNEFAYPEGATLIRRNEFFNNKTDAERQYDAIEDLKQNLLSENDTLSESSRALLQRIDSDLASKKINSAREENALIQNVKGRSRQNIIENNTVSENLDGIETNQLVSNEAIGIELLEIMNKPGSTADLEIREGDILYIPKKQETVRVRGSILYPTSVRYNKGSSLKHYISNAGGFESNAKKSRTYIIYPNGSVDRTRKFLFFNRYPKVQPGSEIIVPKKPQRNPIGLPSILGIASTLATLILAISAINP